MSVSYIKTNKLITALYMVTDIIDKDEPLRNKLRTLGAEIISDIHSIPANAYSRITQIISFLDIAAAINIVSEMNSNILRKEFNQLIHSIKEDTNKVETLQGQMDLSEIFSREALKETSFGHEIKDKNNSIGHQTPTRIGVQKGSTLMKALSEKTQFMSLNISSGSVSIQSPKKNNFEELKQKRREEILAVIKATGMQATIKDIREKINNGRKSEDTFSEKTLQRELMSMIKDNVLQKAGEKRWSRYFLAP